MTEPLRRWRFFRAGGFDQVRLDEASDLLAIDQLDQKLWMALSCPVAGIQFDERTLCLIDTDADGHVRAQELIDAVHWARDRLADPKRLALGRDEISLEDIRADGPEGAELRLRLQALLASLDKNPGDTLSVGEIQTAQDRLNVAQLHTWQGACPTLPVLGDATATAYDTLQGVRDKVDDYFLRCRISAFDTRAQNLLDPTEDHFKALGSKPLVEPEALTLLPLARITPSGELALDEGLNPAWQEALQALRQQVITPLCGHRSHLTAPLWEQIKQQFADYARWVKAKPASTPEDELTLTLERLTRYKRDLMTLANNFVAFKAFYTRQGKATFQAGTLYLDGRSCELCITVTDPARHALLAALSRICLVYCDCTRAGKKMSIAAAFTAGDSDQLMVGRNGVFYDRLGQDWDATILKIIDHPISLRQAFWSPYKRFVKMLGEQLQKLAASKAGANEAQLSQAADAMVKPGGVPTQNGKSGALPSAPPFDVAKFAGIFAAIGMAVGAIGTALASVTLGLLALKWWQIPLALLGFMLAISTPAVALAWFKLRTRNLGPLLDANGWAINARAHINIPFGTSLTQLAQLPQNAERSLTDPYADKKPSLRFYLLGGALLLLGLVAAWWMWKHNGSLIA